MGGEVVYALLVLMLVPAVLLAVGLGVYGLLFLGRVIIVQLRRLVTHLRGWGRSRQQIRLIRAIGHQARRDMQELYREYLAQVNLQKGR